MPSYKSVNKPGRGVTTSTTAANVISRDPINRQTNSNVVPLIVHYSSSLLPAERNQRADSFSSVGSFIYLTGWGWTAVGLPNAHPPNQPHPHPTHQGVVVVVVGVSPHTATLHSSFSMALFQKPGEPRQSVHCCTAVKFNAQAFMASWGKDIWWCCANI